MVYIVFVWVIGSFVVIYFFGKKFIVFNMQWQGVEVDYCYFVMQLWENVEQIVFYKGGKCEYWCLIECFDYVKWNFLQIVICIWKVDVVCNIYGFLFDLLSMVVVLLLYFVGKVIYGGMMCVVGVFGVLK